MWLPSARAAANSSLVFTSSQLVKSGLTRRQKKIHWEKSICSSATSLFTAASAWLLSCQSDWDHDPEELHRPQKVLPASPSHFKSPACVCADPEGWGGQGGTWEQPGEILQREWCAGGREVKLEKENVREIDNRHRKDGSAVTAEGGWMTDEGRDLTKGKRLTHVVGGGLYVAESDEVKIRCWRRTRRCLWCSFHLPTHLAFILPGCRSDEPQVLDEF